ncbi:MAG: hypothetical protein JO020_29045 [Chloroflexi bacterium]|nr:hypothetical protein [Chloroflexota bacterium]MBV9898223.1 hypothetical protein [Chloroflexota bacterium]
MALTEERAEQSGAGAPEVARRRAAPGGGVRFWWLARQLGTIALAHVAVLVIVYFLLLLGDALFTSYAILLQDAVFVSYVAQLGWLQRMASDVKGAIAFVVAISALLQMLLLTARAIWSSWS